MKTTILTLALVPLAGVPALAMQQPAAKQGATPYTVRGQLTLCEMIDYNGDSWGIDSASGRVHDATLIGVEGQIGSARPAPAVTPAAAPSNQVRRGIKW